MSSIDISAPPMYPISIISVLIIIAAEASAVFESPLQPSQLQCYKKGKNSPINIDSPENYMSMNDC